MEKPRVYIDQNILGLALEGLFDLIPHDEYEWIYSKEHFREIARSKNPDQYLEILDKAKAVCISVKLDEHERFTNGASIDARPVFTVYEEFIENTGQVHFDDEVFNALIAWFNGGASVVELEAILPSLQTELTQLLKDAPVSRGVIMERLHATTPQWNGMLEQLIEHGNDVNRNRAEYGDVKGSIGDVKGRAIINQLWSIVSKKFPSVTLSQFFGFDPHPSIKGEYSEWPIYLGILGCCSVFDIIGYKAEKKSRKTSKIPNVSSDAVHISMGAFCYVLLTRDEKLFSRAEAIYEHLGIATKPILIEKKSIQGKSSRTAPLFATLNQEEAMNIEVLSHIVNNSVELIERLADENGLDCSASVGVAKLLIGNNGNISELSPRQKHHYEKCIQPLIEDVPCEGVIGPVEEGSTCSGNGYIDDESLLGCYLEDDFKCQLCRYDSEKINGA